MIKRSIILSLIASLILVSCERKVQPKEEPARLPPPVLGEYYFDFDEVVYYNASDDSPYKFIGKGIATRKDSIAINIFLGESPSINDTVSLAYLDSVGFRKKNIPKSEYNFLKEVFREKSFTLPTEDTACAPIYRDIYVIKSKGKNVGIVKICYECGHHYITGTKVNTEGFGLNGEYAKLLKLTK